MQTLMENTFQDSLITKTTKKSPLTWRMLVLIFLGVFGIYGCSSFSEQTNIHRKVNFLYIHLANPSCTQSPDIQQWQIPYLHYPKPKTFSREECICSPVRFFATLSTQRSGSGWFETLLNSHTNVSCNGEIFGARDRRHNASSVFNTLDQVYNLDLLTSASKNECSAAVGFKWMLNQGVMKYHEEIVYYFNRRHVSAILLFRRNLLRRKISLLANKYDKDVKPLNGIHKSHTHSPLEAKILAKYKPRINTTSLVSELRKVEGTTTKVIEYFKSTRHIVVYYEDLVSNRNKVIKEVQEFLGLPCEDLRSGQVKIHSAPLSNQVENWDEVKGTLNRTSFESFLQPDY